MQLIFQLVGWIAAICRVFLLPEMQVVVRVARYPLFASRVLHNVLNLMRCYGSDALVCVCKVGADFLRLAPGPPLELAAQSSGNVAVARSPTVLT